MCKTLIITAKCLMFVGFAAPAGAQIQFWLSSGNEVLGANLPVPAASVEIQSELGNPTEVLLWAKPEPGKSLENFSLNLVSDSDTILQFDSVVIHNEANGGGNRFEFLFDSPHGLTVEEGLCDDESFDFENIPLHAIWGMRAFTLNADNGAGLAAAEDTGELLATISVTGLSLGSAELFLQVGDIGINQADETTSVLGVSFGDPNDPILSAETQRCQSSTTAEATIAVLEDIPIVEGIPGDFNDDGELTAADIDLLSAENRKGTHGAAFDLTDDALVNDQDREVWVESLKGTHFGDANLNGTVGFEDFLSLSENFSLDGGWAQGDFNGSGNVNFPDFLVLSEFFGLSAEEVQAVPEPAGNTLVNWIVVAVLVLSNRSKTVLLRQQPR